MKQTYIVTVDAPVDAPTLDRLMEASITLLAERVWDWTPTDTPWTITTTDSSGTIQPYLCHEFTPEESNEHRADE